MPPAESYEENIMLWKIVMAFIIVALVCVGLIFAGLGWVIYSGVDFLSAQSHEIQQGGLKSVFEAVWCGRNGCQ